MDNQTLTNDSRIAAPPSSALRPLRSPFRLPVETLVEIFLLSLPPIYLAQAPQKTALSLVCRLWNAIVDSTPILWSRVTTADPISYVRKSLFKSGERQLDVYASCITYRNVSMIRCDGVCREFMREVGPCIARWGRVVLGVCYRGIKCIQSDASLPSLSLFKVLWSHLDVAVFSQARSPNLRELSLQSSQIRSWNLTLLPQSLSRLDIVYGFQNNPSLAGWLSILSACPNLTALRVGNMGIGCPMPNDNEPNHTGPLVVVELPALQNLELLFIHSRVARCLLTQLRFPDECAATVRCGIKDSSPSASFLSPALSRHRTFQQEEKTDRATVALTEVVGIFRVIAVRQRWCVDIALAGVDGVRDALEWFGISTENDSNPWWHSESPQAGPSNYTTLLLDERASKHTPKPGGGYTSSLDFDLLSAISIYQYLILEIKTRGLTASEHVSLFRYISGHRDPNKPTTRYLLAYDQHDIDAPYFRIWRFSNLRKLVLEGMNADTMRALLDAIKTRSVDDAVAPGMLLRLKRIEFVDADAPTREGENHALGDVHEEERLVLDILDILDEDAELIWKGKHFSKASNHK